MLMTLDQAKNLRWIKSIENTYPKQMFHFLSDGTETSEDVKYMIDWANTWSDIYGYQILDNYDELKDKLSK